MLSILLLILKIILYVFLVLLGLIILILIMVLFSNFQYNIIIDKPSGFKDISTLKLDVSVSWLWKILKVNFKFKNKKHRLNIKIFNFSLGSTKRKKHGNTNTIEKEKTKEQIQGEEETNTAKVEEEKLKQEEKQKKKEDKKAKKEEKKKAKGTEPKIDVLSYLKDMYFIRSVCKTIKNILKIILPNDFYLKAIVGLPDPALTAYISGFSYAIFMPLSKNIFIDSNFEEEVIIVNCNINGKFKLWTILRETLWFLEYELNKRKFFGKKILVKFIKLLKP